MGYNSRRGKYGGYRLLMDTTQGRNIQIILTGNEVEALYRFYKSQPQSVWAGLKSNVVIKHVSNNVGNCTYIQTQDDLCEGKDNWENITDYEAW